MNGKMIIFDGPDNVGKGTQIEKLRRQHPHKNFVLLNLERPFGKNDAELLKNGFNSLKKMMCLAKAGLNQGANIIIDRAHYTEYAYSIFRDGHAIEKILELENFFEEEKRNILSIIFVDKAKNIASREDGLSNFDTSKIENFEMLCARFTDIAHQSHFNTKLINIDSKNEDKVFEILNKEYKKLLN